MKRRNENHDNKDISQNKALKSSNNMDDTDDSDTEEVSNISTVHSEDLRMSTDDEDRYTDQEGSSSSLCDSSDLDNSPSTVMDLERIRQKESSLFPHFICLKTNELLAEVKPKEVRRSKAAAWCAEVKNILLNAQFSLDVSLSERLSSDLLGMKFPLIQKPQRVNGRFKFVKPNKVTIVGSFETGSCLKKDMAIDMAVEIPKEIFSRKDYLNEKYIRKRALYLCCLANILICSDEVDVGSMNFVVLRNMDKPLLLIKPAADWRLKCKLYLTAVPEKNTFDIERFMPSKNNVRFEWYFPGTDLPRPEANTPTPHYNAAIGQDIVSLENDNECKKVFQTNQQIGDAMILLKLWMNQRDLNTGMGSIGSFVISMFVVHLYKKNIINDNMNPLQIMYNVMHNLAKSKWDKEGINLSDNGVSAADMDLYNVHYDVVMIDVTGTVNLASDVYLHTYLKMIADAQHTVKFLKSKTHNEFEKLFLIPKLSFIDQFDQVLRFNSISLMKTSSKDCSPMEYKLDWRNDHLTRFVKLVTSLLEEGLERRVLLIVPIANPNELGLSLTVKRSLHSNLSFGIKLDPGHALRVITMGPEANISEEAMEFRNFWGPRAELRRFRDGIIKESMLWTSADHTLSRKRLIAKDIVDHLVDTKLGIDGSNYVYIADQFDPLITDCFSSVKYCQITTGEELTSIIVGKFNIFAKKIAAVETLPFKIVAVKGNCPVIRNSALFPSRYTLNVNEWIHSAGSTNPNDIIGPIKHVVPVEGLLEVSLDTWPDDISTIPSLLTSWLKRVSIKLNEESGLFSYSSTEYVDVHQDEYVFRFKVYFPAFESLLAKKSSEGIRVLCADDKLIAMSKSLKFHSDVTDSLIELQTIHKSYGASCSMAKRWLSSQLIDSIYFPEIYIDLLMASLFTEPFPYDVSMQPQTMFIRFIALLATHSWGSRPIVIHFEEKVPEDVIKRTEEAMATQRDTLPAAVILTPYNLNDYNLSKDDPSAIILYYVRNLAIKAYKFVQDVLPLGTEKTMLKDIFLPSLSGYNIIIKLKPLENPNSKYGVDYDKTGEHLSLESNSRSRRTPPNRVNERDRQIVDFNVVESYVNTLRNTYDKQKFLFFYDQYGGNVIGIRINPITFEPRKVEVTQLQDTEQLEENVKFSLDTFVNNVKILGGDIVEEIKVQNVSSS